MLNNSGRPSLKMNKTALLVLSILQVVFASNLSIVLFPFKNETPSDVYSWVGYAFPEAFATKLDQLEDLQIRDPVYLFQVDSNGYDMSSDSLITVHRNRWGWDVLIGGRYVVRNDSVYLRSKIVWATGKDEPLKMETKFSSKLDEISLKIPEMILKNASLLKIALSAQDSARILEKSKIPASAYKTYLAGYGFEMKKDFNAAMIAFSRAVEIEPEYGSAWCRMARLSQQSGEVKNTKSWFDRAVNSSPHDPDVVAQAANFLVDSDLFSEASGFILTHKKALEKSASGLMAIGKLYLAQGETQRAVAVLTKAVASGPSDLDVEFSLGLAYLATGEYMMAIEFFNRLIKARPDHLLYYSSLGAAYRKAGQLMESSMILESALAMEPQNSIIMVDLAHTYFKLSWYHKAAQLLQKVREADPGLKDVLVNLGVVYYHLGNKKEAQKLFRKAASNPSLRQSALNNSGNILFIETDLNKAIRAYRNAYKSGKKNPSVLYNLAQAYAAKGKLKKAYYYYDELLSLSPGRTDVLLVQADIAKKLKRYEDAEQCFSRALDISPYHEGALNGLVDILVDQKRFEDAAKPMESYLEHLPNNKEMIKKLAGIYRMSGWYEVAIMKYQIIARDYPDDPDAYLSIGYCMYDMVLNKGARNYEDVIYAMKTAAQYNPENPEPDIVIGDVYMSYRGFRDLAIEHWEKALVKTKDEDLRKIIKEKIKGAKK